MVAHTELDVRSCVAIEVLLHLYLAQHKQSFEDDYHGQALCSVYQTAVVPQNTHRAVTG